MQRHSLSHALARQWMIFTAVLSVLFIAGTLLLLFVLEDSFINRRMHAVATTVTEPSTLPLSLPAQFQVMDSAKAPDDIRARLMRTRPGGIVEFRRSNGRYVHVMSARRASGEPRTLIYDVTDELTVNPGLSRGLAYALALLTMLLVCAYALSRLFVARTLRRTEGLIRKVLASPDPDSLDVLAGQEPVYELEGLLRLHASVWRKQLTAVQRERETLAFLGHELRTPLQSACTSMALMEEHRDHLAAWTRLQRAIRRLTRASNAILWLSTDARDVTTSATPALACLTELVQELQPLADARGQAIVLTIEATPKWAAPRDVIETLLANLLRNAIQHGGAGTIAVHADADVLVMTNSYASDSMPGFGLGLDIANRLAARIDWRLAFGRDGDGVHVTLRWPES
ncbi:MAG: HAMP domain-containing sensor histidine kinase [Rhodanobacter sp.]